MSVSDADVLLDDMAIERVVRAWLDAELYGDQFPDRYRPPLPQLIELERHEVGVAGAPSWWSVGASVWKELTTPMELDVDGPSDVELAAIELEWPLIAAELGIVDAEIRLLTAVRPTELDWRRLRRAEHRRLRALAELLSRIAERGGRVAA